MSFCSQGTPRSPHTFSTTTCASSHRWQPGLRTRVTDRALDAGAFPQKRGLMASIVPPLGGHVRRLLHGFFALFNDPVAESSHRANSRDSGTPEQTGYAHDMAALGWLTPRRRSATAR